MITLELNYTWDESTSRATIALPPNFFTPKGYGIASAESTISTLHNPETAILWETFFLLNPCVVDGMSVNCKNRYSDQYRSDGVNVHVSKLPSPYDSIRSLVNSYLAKYEGLKDHISVVHNGDVKLVEAVAKNTTKAYTNLRYLLGSTVVSADVSPIQTDLESAEIVILSSKAKYSEILADRRGGIEVDDWMENDARPILNMAIPVLGYYFQNKYA